jgi:hypothetical protein
MPNIVEKDYLENPYDESPYLAGDVYHGVWSQVNRQINTVHRVNEQVSRTINTTHHVKEQIDRQISGNLHRVKEQTDRAITTTHHAKEQVDRQTSSQHHVKEQVDRSIGTSHRTHEQLDRSIGTYHSTHEQVSRQLIHTHSIHQQIARQINGFLHRKHEEIRRGNVLFLTCGVYLEGGYLEDPYLAPMFCAHMRSQVSRETTHLHAVPEQIERSINAKHRVKEQIQRRIDVSHHDHEQIKRMLTKTHSVHEQIQRQIVGFKHRVKEQISRRVDVLHHTLEQIDRLNSRLVHEQITLVLYNTTNLRILLDFPSRGTSGVNWIANSTAPGDFSVNNLNTDIVEQVWRSNPGTKTGIQLSCDTQVTQGIFVDTLAILNHNLTTSASILWEASNAAGFTAIGFSQVLPSTKNNIYYIAPTLPTTAFKYHRFTIDDNTNTQNYLQIGTIVFGSSIIFQGECFVDQVTRQTVHFADKIMTEAFTNISNDRALKFAVGLEFRSLNFNQGNYSKMRTIFETARTSLKCLWIPTPQYPSRYGIFGKLQSIPPETHNDLGTDQDYVSFSIDVDESL